MRRRAAALFALPLLLAGCKEEHKASAAKPGTPIDTVKLAVLHGIAARPGMPKTVQFRGVQAYAQAAPRHTAVCGLVTPFPDDTTIFVPFVAVAAETTPPGVENPQYDLDLHMGTSTTEATRTYLSLIADCWDNGGPAPERPLAVAPLPSNLADPHLPAAATADPAPPPPPGKLPRVVGPGGGAIAAGGTVTVRQAANVHFSPGGPSVGTVQPGQPLTVLATAPGGWYQLGAGGAPLGWVHESMLNR